MNAGYINSAINMAYQALTVSEIGLNIAGHLSIGEDENGSNTWRERFSHYQLCSGLALITLSGLAFALQSSRQGDKTELWYQFVRHGHTMITHSILNKMRAGAEMSEQGRLCLVFYDALTLLDCLNKRSLNRPIEYPKV